MRKFLLSLSTAMAISIVATAQTNVGIGTSTPASKMDVKGNLTVGSTYSGTTAPIDGAIIEGPVGIGTKVVGTNAALDVSSTTKGMYIPRFTNAQRTALTSSLSTTDKGLLIFNTDNNRTEFWDGTQWLSVGVGAGGPPTGAAGGDLAGSYPSPTIATSAVTSAKILDNTITSADLAIPAVNATTQIFNTVPVGNGGTGQSSLTTNGVVYGNGGSNVGVTTAPGAGQVMIGNASGVPSFAPLSGDVSAVSGTGSVTLANTTVSPATYGSGTQVAQITVDGKGRITNAGNVAITGAAPTGAAGGDLTGSYPSPTIATGTVTSGKILDGTIVDADVNASAAIQRNKLAVGTANQAVINDGSGNLSSEAQLAIARGGTNATSANYTSGKFLAYDGTRLSSTGYDQSSFASSSAVTTAVSGTTNYVSKFTGTNTIGNSQVFDNGSNVGVGTTTPSGKLDVYTTGANGDGAVFSPALTQDNNFTIQTYIDATAGGGYANRTTYASACCNNLALNPDAGTVSIGGVSGNYGANKLNVIGQSYFSGNVGIGTTSPSRMLHVAGPGLLIYGNNASNTEYEDWPNSSFAIRRSDDFTANGITMATFGYRSDPVYVTDNSVANIRIWTANGGVGSLATSNSTTTLRIGSPGPMGLGVGNSQDQVYIDATGKVGIGTTTPGFKLHVPSGYIGADYINTTDNAITSGVTGIMAKQGDNYYRTASAAAVLAFLGVTAPTGDNLGNHVATTTLNLQGNAVVGSAGTVLDGGGGWIRTYNSTGWFNGTYAGGFYMSDGTWIRGYNGKSLWMDVGLIGGDGGLTIGYGGAGPGSHNAIIQGNLGVGTSGPGYKLDVVGDMNFSSTVKFNGINVIFGNQNDVYGNFRVLQNNSSSSQDGMYLNYNSTGSTGADLRLYANGTNERVRISASTGNVGVGTAGPNARLDVSSNGGSDGIAMGQIHGDNTETIQTYIDGQYSNRASYASGCCNGLFIQPDVGYVTIGGTSSLASRFTVNGLGNNGSTFTTNGSYQSDWPSGWGGSVQAWDMCVASIRLSGTSNRSDIRLKKDIENLNTGTSAVETLNKLRPVTYHWIDPRMPKNLRYGFIAQEIQQVLPELVDVGTDSMKTLGVNYTDLIPILTQAVQEQQKTIEALKTNDAAELNKVKAELEELKALIDKSGIKNK